VNAIQSSRGRFSDNVQLPLSHRGGKGGIQKQSGFQRALGLRRGVGGGGWTINFDQFVASPRMKVSDLAGKRSEEAAKGS